MDTEKEAFLTAIAKDRYDQTTRLVFANWLEENGLDDEALIQRSWTREKQESEDWLRDYAAKCGETCTNYSDVWQEHVEEEWQDITYEMVVQAGHDYVNHGNYSTQVGSEKARDLMYGETAELFWKHWQTVTGRTKAAREEDEWMDGPFSCTC